MWKKTQKREIAVAKKVAGRRGDAGRKIHAREQRRTENSRRPRWRPRIIPKGRRTGPKYLTNCIESFKEMADYGGKVGVKVTLENHWGTDGQPDPYTDHRG